MHLWQQRTAKHLISYDYGVDGFVAPPGAHDIHRVGGVTAGSTERFTVSYARRIAQMGFMLHLYYCWRACFTAILYCNMRR